MLDQIMFLMEKQDFDRCVWEQEWEELTFFDRKDHDPYGFSEFELGSETRNMWLSIVVMLVKNKIKSFEIKLN